MGTPPYTFRQLWDNVVNEQQSEDPQEGGSGGKTYIASFISEGEIKEESKLTRTGGSNEHNIGQKYQTK